MTTVLIGNDSAIEGFRDPKSEEPERLRFRAIEGERITSVQVPDDWTPNEQFAAVVAALPRHLADGAKPAWIECENEGLCESLKRHLGLDGRAKRPAGWGDPEHPTVEEGQVKPRKARKAAKKAPKAAATLLALHLWAMLFLATRFMLRTNAGRDWQCRVLGDPASDGTGNYAAATWIGLTSNNAAPSAANLSLPGEIITGTLARKQAAYSHTNGTASYTLTAPFTSDQEVTIYKLGVYTDENAGTLFLETMLSSPVIFEPGDQTTIIETVTV